MSASDIIIKLGWRYAVKQFDNGKTLSESQISELKEVLRLAPSSFGMQPWRFVFVEDKNTRAQLLEKCWKQSQITDASHLIVLCTPNKVDDADVEKLLQKTADVRSMPVESLKGYGDVIKGFLSKFSDETARHWMSRQVYLALGSLLTACALLDIDACPMEGFEADGVDQVLGLSDKGLVPVVLCTLGYRASGDKYAALPKVRYEESELFMTV